MLLLVSQLPNHDEASSPAPRDPFSLSQRSAVPFTLYYPIDLPSNLSVIQPLTQQVQIGTVILVITGSEGRSATLSQQAVVAGFDHQTLRRGLTAIHTVDTSQGQAVIGTADSGTTRIGSLITDDGTWLLITAPTSVSTEEIVFILQNLQADHT